MNDQKHGCSGSPSTLTPPIKPLEAPPTFPDLSFLPKACTCRYKWSSWHQFIQKVYDPLRQVAFGQPR